MLQWKLDRNFLLISCQITLSLGECAENGKKVSYFYFIFQLEKLRMAKTKDNQLDSTAARYEERLVELHSVIAELSRLVGSGICTCI